MVAPARPPSIPCETVGDGGADAVQDGEVEPRPRFGRPALRIEAACGCDHLVRNLTSNAPASLSKIVATRTGDTTLRGPLYNPAGTSTINAILNYSKALTVVEAPPLGKIAVVLN